MTYTDVGIGVAWHMPHNVHYGHAEGVQVVRAEVLSAAYARNPERFVRQHPERAAVPVAAWINEPAEQDDAAPRRRDHVMGWRNCSAAAGDSDGSFEVGQEQLVSGVGCDGQVDRGLVVGACDERGLFSAELTHPVVDWVGVRTSGSTNVNVRRHAGMLIRIISTLPRQW